MVRPAAASERLQHDGHGLSDGHVAHTNFHASFGGAPIMFSTHNDGGASFSHPQTISTGGPAGTPNNQGVDIAVGSDGTIYVGNSTFERSTGTSSVNLVKSSDCGRKWSQPVVVGTINDPQAPGVAFRTPTFAFVAVDNTNPNLVYVAYQSLAGTSRRATSIRRRGRPRTTPETTTRTSTPTT